MALHVLTVVPYFFPAWAYGGIPRLAYGLSRALLERGHRVTVVTTDVLDREHRSAHGRLDLDGLTVHRLRNVSNRLAYEHQLFLPRGMFSTLKRLVPSADVVHLHGWWHLLNNAAALPARAASVPLVHTPNGTLPAIERKEGIKALWRPLLGDPVKRQVQRWIAVSRAELNQLRRAGLDASQLHLIHNGIDLGEFERLPERGSFRRDQDLGDGPLVLYLGKLTPRKGVDHLVAAMAQLKSRDATLIVAGNDMGVLPGLRRQVRELDLGARVRFVGLLTGADRLAALADADLLVYASTDEIFGLVPFEGLLCGTPAVVSDDCGCGELVAQARAGELVRYGQPRSLARAIDGLLGDAPRRERMVLRGRRFVQQNFSWERIARQTEAVYHRAIAERPR